VCDVDAVIKLMVNKLKGYSKLDGLGLLLKRARLLMK
jgi:hypothetical protein